MASTKAVRWSSAAHTVRRLLRYDRSSTGRAALNPAPGLVRFGDLRRLAPLSSDWGLDRGEPIDRYYIEHFLARHARDVRGRVLEFSDSAYARRFGGGRVASIQVVHHTSQNPRATLVTDITKAFALPPAAFDCIVLTQVLQYIPDLEAAVATLCRALGPGGVLLATLPGVTRVHQNDWDGPWLWAFTARSAQHLFAPQFTDLTVDTYGNVLTATASLHGLAASEIRREELAHGDARYPVLIGVRARTPHAEITAA